MPDSSKTTAQTESANPNFSKAFSHGLLDICDAVEGVTLVSLYKSTLKPKQSAAVRRSVGDLAAEAKFKNRFDKLFKPAMQKAVTTKSAVDASLDRAYAMAKRIGDARRQEKAQELSKLRAESRAISCKIQAMGRQIEEAQRSLKAIEKSQSAERVGRRTVTALAPAVDDSIERALATLRGLPQAEIAKMMQTNGRTAL